MKKLSQQYIDHAVNSVLCGFPTELNIHHEEEVFDTIVSPLLREALARGVKVVMTSPFFRHISFYKERVCALFGEVVNDPSKFEILSKINPDIVDAMEKNDKEAISTASLENPAIADNLAKKGAIMVIVLDAQAVEGHFIAQFYKTNPNYLLVLRRYS